MKTTAGTSINSTQGAVLISQTVCVYTVRLLSVSYRREPQIYCAAYINGAQHWHHSGDHGSQHTGLSSVPEVLYSLLGYFYKK